MSEINLTQAEADFLMAMDKHLAQEVLLLDLPERGQSVRVSLISADQREKFMLDMHRGRINLAKITYQNRARKVVVLQRLDIKGAPHRNPDGEEIPSTHLHVYREGFGDKWACPVPDGPFRDLDDYYQTLQDFMKFCNVVQLPGIRRRLFA